MTIKCPICGSELLAKRIDDGITINRIELNGEITELSNKSNGYDEIICSKNENHVIPNDLQLKVMLLMELY